MIQSHDFIGIAGAFLILFPYFLLQARKMSSSSFWYSFLNLAGSFLIIYSLTHSWNLTAFLIEIIWAIVSFYGLIKWYQGKFGNHSNSAEHAEE